MLYFKAYRNFTEYVPIEETELEKGLAAFRYGTAAIFQNGALEKIESIVPDLNRSMGWNPTYKLDDDDWIEIRNKGIDRKCALAITATKEKIDYLENSGQKHLIGKNAETKLPEKPKNISDTTKDLAEKFKKL